VFRQVFMPYYQRVAGSISIPWIFHTDGNFLPVLEDLLSLGMNALHPIEPDAVDIHEVKRRVAGRAALVGNIDINLLSSGTSQEVEQVTCDTIRAVGKDGRFILSSSNSITRSCRVDNVLTMVKTCRECGRYPFESE
ncbi:MAG TPA: uroporphyrinogen decarboxylase family protein, partial [Anaerolineales bacterium]